MSSHSQRQHDNFLRLIPSSIKTNILLHAAVYRAPIHISLLQFSHAITLLCLLRDPTYRFVNVVPNVQETRCCDVRPLINLRVRDCNAATQPIITDVVSCLEECHNKNLLLKIFTICCVTLLLCLNLKLF